MEVLFNQDCSYFSVDVLENLNATGSVTNLTIIEEMQKIVTGSISFLDPAYKFTNAFRPGTRFKITWGYKNRNSNIALMSLQKTNPQELITQGVRRGQNCIVITPSWSANDKGQIIYSCNFMGGERDNNTGRRKIYTSGTKYNLISQIFDNLKINNKTISFNEQNDNISAVNYEMQNETDFKFLLHLSYDWRCTFKIGYNSQGQLCGIFVDNTKIGGNDTKNYITSITGGTGSTKSLEFGIGSANPNVSSWNGQQHIGDNGMGDGVIFDIIDGKPVFTKYVVEGNTVKAYKLDQDKVNSFAESPYQDSNAVMDNVLKSNSMDSQVWETTKVKDFFTPEMVDTAPQGLGYSGNLEMIGDTGMTPYIELKFGNGFPPPLKDPKPITKFFCKRATHNLNESGYKMSVEFADTITTFAGSQIQ